MCVERDTSARAPPSKASLTRDFDFLRERHLRLRSTYARREKVERWIRANGAGLAKLSARDLNIEARDCKIGILPQR